MTSATVPFSKKISKPLTRTARKESSISSRKFSGITTSATRKTPSTDS